MAPRFGGGLLHVRGSVSMMYSSARAWEQKMRHRRIEERTVPGTDVKIVIIRQDNTHYIVIREAGTVAGNKFCEAEYCEATEDRARARANHLWKTVIHYRDNGRMNR